MTCGLRWCIRGSAPGAVGSTPTPACRHGMCAGCNLGHAHSVVFCQPLDHLLYCCQLLIHLPRAVDLFEWLRVATGDSLCDPMERRMNLLRGAVSQHRGSIFRSFTKAMGFSSRLSSKPSHTTDASGPQLPEDSPQSRLRLLGDLYFMIGQYQDAEGCYSDAAEEFRTQKATQKWAAALEALSLSRFMQVSGGTASLDIWKCAPCSLC